MKRPRHLSMPTIRSSARASRALLTLLLLGCAACGPGTTPDREIEARVRSALLSAADVPGSQLEVVVTDGVVTITGSIECEPCGGRTTPGGSGTIAQSVGAIVRAVPGVESVRFLVESEAAETP